mgnify:CR=1 FL=1
MPLPRLGAFAIGAAPDRIRHAVGRAQVAVQERFLPQHRVVGYIADMIFDKELDYLGPLGANTPPMASNSVSVQLNFLRAGGRGRRGA